MLNRKEKNNLNLGFSTQALKHFEFKGHWTSLKKRNKNMPTKSFKVVFKNTLTFCVPAYTYNKDFNQFKLSNRHNFWVLLDYKLYKKLDLKSKGYKYSRLINLTAYKLIELINLILYIKRAKNKQRQNQRLIQNHIYNYKEVHNYNYFTNLVLKLNEKLLNFLSNYYILNNFWKLNTCENILE